MSGTEKQARRLALNPEAVKGLKALPPKHCKQVALAILSLLENATPQDSKMLAGYSPWRRVDIGEYRIIYRFDDDTVYVPIIGKRNDDEIYRRFKR